MAVRRTKKLYASGIAFLDPIDCDSTIGYHVTKRGKYLSGTVDLSDCNRKITWYFSSTNQNSLSKVDIAIKMLESFRTELGKAFAAEAKKKTAAK
jgi:hypothetical protein